MPAKRARKAKSAKTKGPVLVPTGASVKAYLDGVADETRRKDARRLAKILREETGERPAMWGPSIVGFGSHHYVYASGREGDMPRAGFAARKSGLVIYMPVGYEEERALLAKLGPHSTGVSCLYVKRLDELDEKALRELVRRSLVRLAKMFPQRSV